MGQWKRNIADSNTMFSADGSMPDKTKFHRIKNPCRSCQNKKTHPDVDIYGTVCVYETCGGGLDKLNFTSAK